MLDLLGITKQSLSRVLGEVQTRALVTQRVGERDRRQRHLHLTEGGRALETQLFDCLRHSMADAYTAAGQQAVGGFWQVLTGLIQPGDREMVLELQRTLD